MSRRKRGSLASVSSGRRLKNRRVAFAEKGFCADAVKSWGAIVKNEDVFSAIIMSPAAIELQESDKDPTTIIFGDALRKYDCMNDVSLHELIHTSEGTVEFCSKQNVLLPSRLVTSGERLGNRILATKSSKRKVNEKLDLFEDVLRSGGHGHFFYYHLPFSQ